MSDGRILPIFPLATVLFPGSRLALHVFEERYRLLVRHCLEGAGTLGIVLIREGWEVGAPATPYDVGTLARLTKVDARSDGTLDVAVVGQGRFRIKSLVPGEPYQRADVDPLAEDVDDVPVSMVEDVRRDFLRYVRAVGQPTSDPEQALRRLGGPTQLSYGIAASFRVSLQEKQQLLEESLAQRLDHERRILRRESTLLQRLGAASPRRAPPPSQMSAN